MSRDAARYGSFVRGYRPAHFAAGRAVKKLGRGQFLAPYCGDLSQVEARIVEKEDMVTPEERLNARGLELVAPPAPLANYVRTVRTGNLVFLSGHGPNRPGGTKWRGKLGLDLGIEEGYAAAQSVMLNLLASLKTEIGELSNVRRVVKLLGLVNSDPDFGDQPKVVNGASDLLVDIFGEKGRHARSAIGVAALPEGIPVEIEMIVEVES